MNVGFVSNVVYPFVKGGAEKRIHEIGRRLAADGHDITVYGRHFWDGPATIEYKGMTLQAVAASAELYEGDRRSITEAIDFSLRLIPELRSALAKRSHDLLVASVFPYFPVLSTKLAGLGEGVPLGATWHEVWGSYWSEYLGWLAPFGKSVEIAAARTPQYPIAISPVTASRLATIGPAREKIEVVPNGIDISRIQTAPIFEVGYDILFVGRLIEHKNVDLLLDAFARVGPRHDATLGIIGDGPEAESLRTRSQSLECSERIEFLGFLDDYDDVLGQMVAADVFVSPSTREGFGITFVEAMAADCTVIAADHPDSAAAGVIGDGGFLVPPTVDAIADTLDSALYGERPPTDPVDRAAQFDWDRVAEQAAAAYERAAFGDW